MSKKSADSRHSNPYLEYLDSKPDLIDPLIPVRPIRDANDPAKVIFVDETREQIPDPPNLNGLKMPMDFYIPDAIDLSNQRVLQMKGIVSVSNHLVSNQTSAPLAPAVGLHTQKVEQNAVQNSSLNSLYGNTYDSDKSANLEEVTVVSDFKSTPYDTAQELINRFHIKTVRGVLHIFNGMYFRPHSSDTAQHFIVKNCRSKVKAAGTPNFPKAVYDCLLKEPRIVYNPSEHNANRFRFVTFENGTLDLKTEQLHPHSPEFFTTYCLNCKYNPNFCHLSTPNFDSYLHQMSGGDRMLQERVLEFIGYCLVPDLDGRVIFLLQGYSGAGKSLISNFLRRFFPEEVVSSLNVYELGDKFAVSELSHKVICLSPDLPAGVLDDKSVSALKKLSGHDRVSSDVKFQSRVEFECEAAFVLATNHMFCTKRRDEALIDRFVVIPFAYPVAKAARMPSLLEKLMEEKDGIANRALQAYFRLRNNHYIFSGNYEINAVTESADTTGNDIESCVASFVQDYCIADPDSGVFLCDAYELFCQHHLSISENQFSQLFYRLIAQKYAAIKTRFRKPSGKNPVSYAKGIRLKKEGETK